MDKFINKILKESEENIDDDPFFHPKDIQKKDEEIKRKCSEFLLKIKSGLRNIKISYENKNWELKEEKMFLKMFSNFHLNDVYDEQYKGYILLDEENIKMCVFDLENRLFSMSHEYIWLIFRRKFKYTYSETKLFMEQMLRKYFELYEFKTLFPFLL